MGYLPYTFCKKNVVNSKKEVIDENTFRIKSMEMILYNILKKEKNLKDDIKYHKKIFWSKL